MRHLLDLLLGKRKRKAKHKCPLLAIANVFSWRPLLDFDIDYLKRKPAQWLAGRLPDYLFQLSPDFC